MCDYNPFSLEGKSILVTGASSGIGQATAIECSRMGARIIAVGRNAERLNGTLEALDGNGHVTIIADLTSQADIETVADSAQLLDGLVLCAGKGSISPYPFCTRDKMDDVFGINFFSPVELLRQLVRKKKFVKGASVVYVASIGGCPGGKFTAGNGIYGASKAALWSMMKFAGKELATKKIRVNGVNPGMVETPLIHHGIITEEQHRQDMENYPLKRYGKPQDIAHGIIYLLSDASSWVTGHSLVIDGGCSI